MSDTPKLDPPELDQAVDILFRLKAVIDKLTTERLRYEREIAQLQRELAETKAEAIVRHKEYRMQQDCIVQQQERIAALARLAALRQAGEELGKFFAPKVCYHCEGTGQLQDMCPNCEERAQEGCCRCGGDKVLAAYLSVASTPDESRALYDGLDAAHAAITALLEPAPATGGVDGGN